MWSSLSCKPYQYSTAKHTATTSQILNLQERDLDILAGHLGYDLYTHQNFYRMPHDTLQLAKVSKLLIVFDQGKVAVSEQLQNIRVKIWMKFMLARLLSLKRMRTAWNWTTTAVFQLLRNRHCTKTMMWNRCPIRSLKKLDLICEVAERAFSYAGPSMWNRLSEDLRAVADPVEFQKQLKTHFFTSAHNVY